jgi:hypothetical protein
MTIRGLDAWLTRDPYADHGGSALVGKPRAVVSKADHVCMACYGPIKAGTRHEMTACIGEEGLFVSPMRTHLTGECSDPSEDFF